MEILPIVFAIALVVLSAVLTAVGIQLVLVLREMRRTLIKVNAAIDNAESKLESVVQPLQRLGGMASGLSTGVKVFEGFVGWLNREKDTKKA